MRERLPNRRVALRCPTTWVPPDSPAGVAGSRFHVTVGFDRDGRVCEIFQASHKTGHELRAVLDDALIAVSVALQSGVALADLEASMGRTTRDRDDGQPTSPIGAILAAAAEIERDVAA